MIKRRVPLDWGIPVGDFMVVWINEAPLICLHSSWSHYERTSAAPVQYYLGKFMKDPRYGEVTHYAHIDIPPEKRRCPQEAIEQGLPRELLGKCFLVWVNEIPVIGSWPDGGIVIPQNSVFFGKEPGQVTENGGIIPDKNRWFKDCYFGEVTGWYPLPQKEGEDV